MATETVPAEGIAPAAEGSSVDAEVETLKTAASLLAIWRSALLFHSENEPSISGTDCSQLQVAMRDIAEMLESVAERSLIPADGRALMYAHGHAGMIESALWQQLSGDPLDSQPTELSLHDLDRSAARVQRLIADALNVVGAAA